MAVVTKTLFCAQIIYGMVQSTTSARVDVEFCDLVANPIKYDQKNVRVNARMVFHPEGGFLYDPKCNSRDMWIFPTVDQERQPGFDPWENAEIPQDRAELVVVGRFEGPRGTRYGPPGGFRHRLVVLEYEGISPVDVNEPWPSETEGPAPLSDAEKEVRKKELEWRRLMAGTAQPAALRRILSNDYFWVGDREGVLSRSEILESPDRAGMPSPPSGDESMMGFVEGIRVFIMADMAMVVHDVGALTSDARRCYTNLFTKDKGTWVLRFTNATMCEIE